MSEPLPQEDALRKIRLKDEYEFGAGYAARWPFYDFSESGIKFHPEAIDHLELEGHETILDIGCGWAGVLKSIRGLGHSGLMVGIDYIEDLPLSTPGELEIFRADASLAMDASNGLVLNHLPFRDDAFDRVCALFMLYHVEDPRITIEDAIRILKPMGSMAVATSGAGNKPQHRRHETMIAAALGADMPVRYSNTFTTTEAEVLLPQLFNQVERRIQQNSEVVMTKDQWVNTIKGLNGALEAYIFSQQSMSKNYRILDDTETKWESSDLVEPIETVVLPDIRRQMEEHGAFVETIERSLYICSDPKL